MTEEKPITIPLGKQEKLTKKGPSEQEQEIISQNVTNQNFLVVLIT